jgi:hypothetical protein
VRGTDQIVQSPENDCDRDNHTEPKPRQKPQRMAGRSRRWVMLRVPLLHDGQTHIPHCIERASLSALWSISVATRTPQPHDYGSTASHECEQQSGQLHQSADQRADIERRSKVQQPKPLRANLPTLCAELQDCFVPFCARKHCTGALTLPARRREDRLDSRSERADNTPQRLQPEEPAMRLQR